MPTYTFIGRVIPAHVNVTINNPPKIGWVASDGSFSMVFTLTIKDGCVTVICEADRDGVPNQNSEMLMRAKDIARTAVNLVAFKHSAGLTVVIDNMIRPDGSHSHITMRDRFLDGLCTAYNLDDQRFSQIMHSIFAEPAWFLALNDLIETIAFAHCGPRNCFRAIEAIRNLINGNSPPKGKERQHWTRMHEALNTSISFIKPVTDFSLGSRHGTTDFVPYDTMVDIKQRSWTVMDRFFYWKLKGVQILPEDEFPLLS